MTITRIRHVRYDTRTDLIEPVRGGDRLGYVRSRGYRIIETVTGWPPYTHLIAWGDEEHRLDAWGYCLAVIDEAG